MKNSVCAKFAIAMGLLIPVALASTVAFAQDNQLILHTQPEPTIIDLTGSVQIDGNGDINATPVDPEACTATGDCEGVAVAVDEFTVNGSSEISVEQGTNLMIRWQTRGAWACDGSGLAGWNEIGKLPTNTTGQSVATTDINPGNYAVGLKCYNGTVETELAQVSLEVLEADAGGEPDSGVPAECSTRTMPSTWNRMTTGSMSCSYKYWTYSQSKDETADCRFINKVWPWNWDEQQTIARVLGVNGNSGRTYIAMEFNSGNVAANAQKQISINIPQSSYLENANKTISISKCPGDFSRAEITEEMGSGCIRKSYVDNFLWGGTDFRSHSGICALEPNTTYYLNIIYTDSSIDTPNTDIIPNATCGSGAGCGSRFTLDNF